MVQNNYVMLILSHNRPDKIYTTKSLQKAGYTGDIYYVVDSADPSLQGYKDKFGDKLCVFDKADYVGKFDKGNNLGDTKGVVYARNACFDIAEKLGYEYFFVFDDDYTQFRHTYDDKEPREFDAKRSDVRNMDGVLDAMYEYFKSTNILTMAFLQGGDLFGGVYNLEVKRKAMNSFICSTKRRYDFLGAINEDVNMYIVYGSKGEVILSIPEIALNQVQTQKNKGGLTEVYLEAGTHVKSFYSVMYNPSSVKISLMGNKFPRLHHKISWNNTVPKILSPVHKK